MSKNQDLKKFTKSDHVLKKYGYFLVAPICLATLSACGSNLTLNLEGRQRTIVVPTHAVVQPDRQRDGSTIPRRYVVRMSDGNLDWEVELPEVATGYELRIPFKGKSPGGSGELAYQNEAPLTAADKELIKSMRRENPEMEAEGVFNESGQGLDAVSKVKQAGKQGTKASRKAKIQQTKSRQSYLVGLEKARQLFKAQKYELAIIALKSLDQDYPSDVTIKSMLGTLWLQLNQPVLAREAWEAALKINPNNRAVIQALKQLQSSLEGKK
ncbi:MAG: hypothetical protein CMH49_09490 [Myxococcales bacterium]|nr:hypothetical protein [Myxococcales bacterium]